jgi:hypothetical protein
MEKFNYLEEMKKVKRKSAIETLVEKMDSYEIVEWILKLEDEVIALEDARIK